MILSNRKYLHFFIVRKLFTKQATNSISMKLSTSHCWKCGLQIDTSKLICPENSCRSIQKLDLNRSLYDLFGLSPKNSLRIDMHKLEENFKKLQKQCHPDLFTLKSLEEQSISNNNSSALNQAFQILRCPMTRLEYILKDVGCTVLDESKGSYLNDDMMVKNYLLKISHEKNRDIVMNSSI